MLEQLQMDTDRRIQVHPAVQRDDVLHLWNAPPRFQRPYPLRPPSPFTPEYYNPTVTSLSWTVNPQTCVTL